MAAHRLLRGHGLLGGPSPAVGDSLVVVPYSSAEVYALRLDNGRPLWNDTVQRPRRTQGLAQINDIDGMPVIEDSLVYVASYGGQMAAIDPLRGIRPGTSIWPAPRCPGSRATSSIC